MDWSLVLATYNRPAMLRTCIELAVAQTRPPREVVVVDASNGWEESREAVAAVLAQHPEIVFEYHQAEQRSLAAQRNQGLRRATADVLFFIDDDSLMYPDCAEEVMRVYEADTAGGLAGVQTNLVTAPPGEMAIDEPRKPSGGFSGPQGMGPVKRWLLRHVLFYQADAAFTPYTGSYPQWTLPPEVRDLDVVTTPLFHGCRMTYRRDVIAREEFEGALRSWSAAEDLDASYRASQHGAIVTAKRARLCHYESGNARLNHRLVSTIKFANQAFFLRKHAGRRAAPRYYLKTFRRLFAEIVKDAAGRRWGFPQVRGLLDSLPLSARVFVVGEDRLDSWYVERQERLLFGPQATPPTRPQEVP